VLATLLVGFFVLATVELAALVRGRALSQAHFGDLRLRLSKRQDGSDAGQTFYVAVGIGTQASALAWKFSAELDGDAPALPRQRFRSRTQEIPTTLNVSSVGRSK